MPQFPTTASLIGMVQAFKPEPYNMAAPMFPVTQTLNNFYEFDVVTGNRGKAAHRLPDGEAGVQALTVKQRKRVMLPTLREKKKLKESTLRWMDAAGKRAPEKAAEAVARELKDLDDIIERTHEYVRWKLLTTGQITLTGDYTDTWNFGLTNTATAGVVWSTVATSTPIADLIAWKEIVRKASGLNPTECHLSSTAIRYIFESTNALKLLGETTKDEYRATGKVSKLVDMDVIVMDNGYTDDAGAYKYYLSTDGTAGNMCLLKVPGPVGVTAEGPAVDADAPDNAPPGKFAKSWVTPDPSARWVLEAQTAMPGITNVNNFGAFTLW